jgi:hypothetical protein
MKATYLGRLTCLAMWFMLASAAQAVSLSLIYKRETDTSVPRTHAAAQAALQALENELSSGDFQLIQPTQTLYDQLGDKPGLVVTFARDAGYAVLVDSSLQIRPYEGTNMQLVLATVKVRVTYGNRLVASLSQSSQMPYKIGPAEARAADIAAQRAAKTLAAGIAEKVERFQLRVASGEFSADGSTPLLSSGGSSQPSLTAQATTVPIDTPVRRKWALLIGVADFQKVRTLNPLVKASDLPSVRNDMLAFRSTLLGLGYKADEITLLIDAQATNAAVRAALDHLTAQTQPEDQVLVVLGTHGLPKDGGWSHFGLPVLYDTDLRDPTGLDFERFKAALKKLPAGKVIWANDTCHSGGALSSEPMVMISSRGLTRVDSTAGFDETLAASQAGKHLAVFASSRETQLSYNTLSAEFGVFSSIFNKALQATGGTLPTKAFYISQLEAQVPLAIRNQYCKNNATCNAIQQPGFAYSGAGDQLRFK